MTPDMAARPQAASVKNEDTPRTVLFVCTGNTCRSPMAAALYNDWMRPQEVCTANPDGAGEMHAVAVSAGLYANEGESMTQEAVITLRQAGIFPLPGNDYTAHRARNITREMMDAADEVVAISTSHAMELTLRFPEHAGKISTLPMDIPDPYGRGSEAYRVCLMQLRYCLQLYCAGAEQT